MCSVVNANKTGMVCSLLLLLLLKSLARKIRLISSDGLRTHSKILSTHLPDQILLVNQDGTTDLALS